MPISPLHRRVLVLPATFGLLLVACGDDDDESVGTVSLEQPSDGATVAGGVPLEMSADGITIEAAGEVHEDAGHFHVIADDGCVEPGVAVPKDADHVHFGGGQREGTIYLEPGSHDLCLQVADGGHVALDATDTVTVEVGITDVRQWCAVIEEIDELFTDGDINSDDFAAVQLAAENIRRLIEQLDDAIDVVDADARPDVAEELAFGRTFTTAFIEAEDPDEAWAAMEEELGAEGQESDGAGSTWILENCGVDIDD